MEKVLCLILHDIRSAYNVGAIFRTADGAGVKKIYLSGYTPCPLTDNPGEKLRKKEKLEISRAQKMLAKTALGAEKSVAWEKVDDLNLLIEKLRQEKFQIISLEKTANAVAIKDFAKTFPSALILGNEVEGVSEETLQQSDAIIFIPMHGEKESLNVSVAAGIAMYEFLG